VNVRVPGDMSALIARSKAIETLATQTLAALDERYPEALRARTARRIRVVLTSEQPLSTGEETSLRDGLRRLASVTTCELLRKRKKELLLEVETSDGATIADLARDLEREGMPVIVAGYSDREILLEHDPTASARVRFFAGPVRGPERQARLLRGFGSDAVLALGFFAPEPRAPARGSWVELRGRVTRLRGKGGFGLRLRTTRFPDRQVLAVVDASCAADDFAACAVAAARRLADGLATKRAGLIRTTRARPGLEIAGLESDGIFPARFGHYLDHPFARVLLRNEGDRVARGVKVRVSIPGLAEPVETSDREIQPQETLVIPVLGVFDRARMEAQSTTEAVVARIEVEYRVDDLTQARSTGRPVLVHERHAMDWSVDQGASVAGFVDGHASSARRISRAVQAELNGLDDQRSPIALPAAVSLAMAGLTYSHDPKSPFRPDKLDFVQFPDETFAEGAGDCDDLSVAFASVVEST